MTIDVAEIERLRAALARADARRDALDAASRAISGLLEPGAVLQLIVDRVRVLVEASYAALGIVDAYGFIERFITSGISAEERERIGAPPLGHGLLGLIIREARAYRIPEISAHPDSSGFPPHHPEMHSFLGVPIVLKGRTIGNFYLTDKVAAGEFSADDQQIVEMFAGHAAIAIDNARLHAEVRRLAVVDERERIGRDLHDGIIQSLYAVSLSLEDVAELTTEAPAEAEQRLERAIESIQSTIQDLRNFIFGLRPELLVRATLVESLRGLVDELADNAGIAVDSVLDPVAGDALPVDVQGELLQVAREALSNVSRHAGARHASVELRSDGRDIILVVADDGRGFDPTVERPARHQGLPNMRRRLDDLGGRLTIESTAGAGARIIARVPRPDDRAVRPAPLEEHA
ncbi:MAG TPA: GAF domain-containing sensor histidine kinase [Candidatus Limnocylindrales bacterium]|nr:GAF domain-containing sensor histidine kinase [Candidatus Limnocylindrales bacterium]